MSNKPVFMNSITPIRTKPSQKLLGSLHRRQGLGHVLGSPTDRVVSPCTQKLNQRRIANISATNLSPEQTNVNDRQLDLEATVMPFPYPGGDLDFVLGTGSAARRQVIDLLGWKYTQISPSIDEKAVRNADPMVMPLLIAQAKADALCDRFQQLPESHTDGCLILTADQIVVFGEEVREKPDTSEEAVRYLRSYSNSAVSTVSAIALTHFPSRRRVTRVHKATVHWCTIPEHVIQQVVSSGEVMHCAGGFRVEDPELRSFIQSISGGIDSVLGLPVGPTISLFDELLDQIFEETDPFAVQVDLMQ